MFCRCKLGGGAAAIFVAAAAGLMCGVGFAQQSDTTAPKSAAATRHTPPVDDEKAYRPPAAERAAQPQEAPRPAESTAAAPNVATTPPVADASAMEAVVIEVSGDVEWAAAATPILAADGWTPVKLNDRLAPGTQVRTGLRSYVNLQFGQTTTISIRSATHASIDQCYRSAAAEVVRMGLGYGTVRGGSTEGEVRSDVIIDSTVATLAKRGTDGWQIGVDAGTGRFRISLARFGLVEARQKMLANQRMSRTVRPGEYATDQNIANMWIKQDIFDRNVTFYESTAITSADAEFVASNTRGYAVVAPGGGATQPGISGQLSDEFVLEQLADNVRRAAFQTIILQPVARPEGHFGTGSSFRVLRAEDARSRRISGKPRSTVADPRSRSLGSVRPSQRPR